MQCSYCQNEMKVKTIRQKRPVPAGARDLGLFDNITCWQCATCGQTNSKGLKSCGQCGIVVIEFDQYDGKVEHYYQKHSGSDTPIELPDRLQSDGYMLRPRCVGCSDCVLCHFCQQPLKTVDFHHYAGGENFSYYHRSCYAQFCAEFNKKEAKAKAEKEKRKRESREAEAKQRSEAGVCATCGRKFGLFEKAVQAPGNTIIPSLQGSFRVHKICLGHSFSR